MYTLCIQLKRKDWRYKAYNVSDSQETSWQEAVVEAQMLETFPIEQRISVFEKRVKDGL